MSKMMVVITPENVLKNAPYDGYESVKELLGGEMSFIASTNISVIPALANGRYYIPVDFISNRQSEEELNAFGSLISGKEIRGNVVVLGNDGENNRGFDYVEEIIKGKYKESFCECWTVKDTLMSFIKSNADRLEFLRSGFNKRKEMLAAAMG